MTQSMCDGRDQIDKQKEVSKDYKSSSFAVRVNAFFRRLLPPLPSRCTVSALDFCLRGIVCVLDNREVGHVLEKQQGEQLG